VASAEAGGRHSRNPLGKGRNGLTGYRIQYKSGGIKRVVCPIGVMGFMSKRLLYTKKLANSPGATHLPGRVCATTLACSAAFPSAVRTRTRNSRVTENNSNPETGSHDF
jgi:hypothetical protein